MKLKFKSKSLQLDEPKVIEFVVPCEYEIFVDDEDDNKEYHTYHFKEPTNGEMNRIEIHPEQINIFAGPTTLSMKLGQKYNNSYIKVDGNKFLLISELLKTQIEEHNKTFEYNLFSANHDLIGKFEVSIITDPEVDTPEEAQA
ncbi:hypothetical protein [Mycoplasmopsis columbinasalis]|uniref:Uncharacterized protein n=1 Tax=Mycoplasmopsis columbinasalis TaxID=114880 RepID=A0A449B9Z0_9BACT|nr:hypothetical protein [Mycoplasmopsis columbinasalis]VEU78010.1 Uncharacterised protein [Mycoplasmopsis columbinasalis]